MAVRTPPIHVPSASVTAEQPVVGEEGFALLPKLCNYYVKPLSPASAAITPIHTADHSLREAHLIRNPSLGMRFGKAAKKKIARPAADVVRKGFREAEFGFWKTTSVTGPPGGGWEIGAIGHLGLRRILGRR